MSHLLESYSLQTGAKISKPFIIKNFFPTPDKYITIHNSSGMGAKNYDYFQEVIDRIFPYLEDKNIKIIQIGGDKDISLDGCIHLHGKTSYHQTAFIIQNSLLHIGNDSFPVHIASAADIPIISLYSVTLPSIAGPVFNSKETFKENVFCFTPDFNGKKPSFNPNENPKLINSIKIENIIEAIDKVLNIDFDKKINTLFIGNKYKQKIIEFVPDTVLPLEFAPGAPAILRVDLLKEDINNIIIYHNLKNRKFAIKMSKNKYISDFNILLHNKDNILEIIYDINDGYNKEYLQTLANIGMHPILLYSGNNDNYFNNLKIDLIDFNLKFVRENISYKQVEDLKEIIKFNNNDIWLESSKIILANNNIYFSESHLKENKPCKEKKIKLNYLTNISNISISDIEHFFITKEAINGKNISKN